MARASDHFEEWGELLDLLNKEELTNDDEERFKELKALFVGKKRKNRKSSAYHRKPIALISPDGQETIYESRRSLLDDTHIDPTGFYDALKRNNGVLKMKKWQGYTIREVETK